MSLAAIADFIQATTGLCAATLGSYSLRRTVGQRLVQQGLAASGAIVSDGIYRTYLSRLSQSPTEQTQLIEALVVPETWFFRDRTPFQLLYRQVHRPPFSGRVLRLLSLPCSTGEETYSLAATLLEAGLPADRFQVDGMDISLRAIATAQQGCYGAYSFRGGPVSFGMGAPLNLQARYCQQRQDGRYQVNERLRACVQFRQGNVMDERVFAAIAPYDIIFCRNLLIYFQPADRIRAIDRLLSQLQPNGLLVVGATEALQMKHPRLTSVGDGFAFRYGDPVPAAPSPAQPPAAPSPAPLSTSLPGTLPRSPQSPPQPPSPALSNPPPTQPAPSSLPPILAQARALADQGQLAVAAQHCQTHLQQQPDSVAGLLLLGILEQAQGQIEAAAIAFEKVLYLEPRHGEALLHLALLREKQGHQRAARQLRRRLARVQGTAPVNSARFY